MERRDEGRDRTRRAREFRRAATAWEGSLWRGLRKGPHRWRRQHPLEGFYLDLYCDAARLAVEADGARHDPAYDAFRDRRVSARGVLTLRFTNDEIGTDLEGCLRRIREAADARAATFAKPRPEAVIPDPTPTPIAV